MNTIHIYLGNALTKATAEFRCSMHDLRAELGRIPGVSMIPYNWVEGVGPDKKINTYEFDIGGVTRADLVVMVVDYTASGVGMEVQSRCQLMKPMRCFLKKGETVTRIIPDCISYHRALATGEYDIPDVIEYSTNADIVAHVSAWVQRKQSALPRQVNFAELSTGAFSFAAA